MFRLRLVHVPFTPCALYILPVCPQAELEDELDDLQSLPLTAYTSPGRVQFVRAKAGLVWRSDKTEHVSRWRLIYIYIYITYKPINL